MNTGTAIYGHFGPDGKLKANFVGGSKIKDTTEKKISQLMKTIQNMVKFPDHPLHIGYSFTRETPMNIPMGDNN